MGLGPFVETQPTSGNEGAKIGIIGQGFSHSSVVKFGGTQATTSTLTGTTSISALQTLMPRSGVNGIGDGHDRHDHVDQHEDIRRAADHYELYLLERGVTLKSTITIKGTGLKQTTKVMFDGRSATVVTVDSDTLVTADVPTGATTGKIAVTTKGGSATSATSFMAN